MQALSSKLSELIGGIDIDDLPSCNQKQIDLNDKYFLVAKVEADDVSITDICDYKLEWAPNISQRPYGYTGAAVKVAHDRGQCLWFEPQRDGKTVYNDKDTIAYVKRQVQDGFAYLVLTLYGPTTDAFEREHCVELFSVGLGAVDWEPFKAGYSCPIKDAFKELLEELRQKVSNAK